MVYLQPPLLWVGSVSTVWRHMAGLGDDKGRYHSVKNSRRKYLQ